MDLAVKYRFFQHLHGGFDLGAEPIYRWHIEARSGARLAAGQTTDKWKTSLEDYVRSATALYESMETKGFDPNHPIPIDRNGVILDGSHRLGCALMLGEQMVPVQPMARLAWAPPWGWDWFVNNQMPWQDLQRLLVDWAEIHDRYIS